MRKLENYRLVVAIAVGLLCDPDAFAQDTPPARSETASSLEESDDQKHRKSDELTAETDRVVVTGSYIPTAETETALPVTVYTADYLRKQGANTPAEGMRQLPSYVGNTATENTSNGGDGSAFINLRALGAGNTLTLINGRRAFSFSNINAIPIGALARAEVLRDGASAIYGSDAVAGVVNFVLLNGPGEAPYQGAEIDLLYGNTTDHDAHVRQTFLRGGVATNKFSLAAAGEYYDRGALFARDREISASADVRFLGGLNNGSSFYPGRITFRLTPGQARTARDSVLIDPSNNAPKGAVSYRAYDGGTGNDGFNFRAYTPAIPPQEKYMYYITARYRVFGEALQLYGDLLYAKTKQDNGLAASPFTIFSSAANASPYNPFPPATLTSIQYRTVRELVGLRKFSNDVDQWRYVAGVNGNVPFTGNDFLSSIGYDAGLVYDRQHFLEIGSGDLQRSPIEAEIRAGNFNPFIGLNAPLAGTIPTYFHGVPTGRSQSYDNVAAAQRAAYISRSNSDGDSILADTRVFGNLFPRLYQGGIAFNVGFEYRYGRGTSVPDPVLAQGDQLGFNPAFPGKGEGDAKSIFGEIQVPLVVSTMNVPGVRSLEIGAAFRYEQFEDTDLLTKSTASSNNGGTPRFTIRYQPTIDMTLRASYGQSFSPPGGAALLGPQSDSFAILYDPLLGRTVGLRLIGGGNPLLQPENTDTYTAGIVLTPRLVPGFTMTLDLYQIFTDGLILGSGEFGQLVLTANGRSGGIAFADLVEREEGTNIPLVVHGVTSNAGKRLVNGMDITAAYELPTQSLGKFTWSLGYNYFFTWKAEPIAGLGTTSFLGNYTATVPLAPGAVPYHKGFLRGEWEWKGFDFVTTMNYISSYNDDSSFLAASHVIGGTDTNPQWDIYRRVSDYVTLDLQLSYEFTKRTVESATASSGKDGKNVMMTSADAGSSTIWQRMLWGTKLTVGVNNAFDRNPPTLLAAFNDNYDTSLYSIRNRYYYISFNKKF